MTETDEATQSNEDAVSATVPQGQRSRLSIVLHSRWFHVAIVILLIASPTLFYLAYYGLATIPFKARFAVGRQGGRHHPVMEALISRLENDPGLGGPDELQMKISKTNIRGSLDAYRGLQFSEFDFALYQAGTARQLNKIEFHELDNFADPQSGKGGNGDGVLDFFELQWRRPATESKDTQRQATEFTFRSLGKNPQSPQAHVDYQEFSSALRIRFVANVFSEVVHFIVPADSDVTSIYDLHPSSPEQRRVVALGDAFSGEFAMSLTLLEAYGLATPPEDDEEAGIEGWSFKVEPFEAGTRQHGGGGRPDVAGSYQQYLAQLERAFSEGQLDAALITMGIEKKSEVANFLAAGHYRLLPIPHVGMLQKKNVLISEYVIPAGMYRAVSPDSPADHTEHATNSILGLVPSRDIVTASVRCKLLVREDMNPRVVAAVTRQVLKEDFQAEQSLDELFARDREARSRFAQDKPEFPIHPGALSVYNPEEFDLGQFEAWDAIYSLFASFVIATFFAGRWIYRRRERNREHRLDRWIQTLLNIEERQLDLDPCPGMHHEAELQALLDEISHLRTHVLAKFSAHELKEDPSGQYFVEMAHSLTNKINAKLSRQRMDSRFDELIEVVKESRPDKK